MYPASSDALVVSCSHSSATNRSKASDERLFLRRPNGARTDTVRGARVRDPRSRVSRRTARRRRRHALNSGTCSSAMYIGSIAIADVAEYGEVSPCATTPTGRSMRRSKPADDSQADSGTRSGSSPAPQLVGARRREQRNHDAGVTRLNAPAPACTPASTRRMPSSKSAGGGKQTDDDERFRRRSRRSSRDAR